MATIVERLHGEFQALASVLEKGAEPSLRVTADDTFRKVLLLSAASHFEHLVIAALVNFLSDASSGNERVVEFVRRKVLSRQYHTLFNWDGSNANSFFGLFGDGFKVEMATLVDEDSGLAEACERQPALSGGINIQAGKLTHKAVAEAHGLAWSAPVL